MDPTAITDWVWPVVASGVAGNAAYDGVKALLGAKFGKYLGYAKENKEEAFKALLQDALEENEALAKQLAELAKQYPQSVVKTIKGDITTGHIIANGDAKIGHTIN